MIRRLADADEIASALELLRAVAADEITLSSRWLADTGVRVVAQESGRHLETDETPLVVRAFAATGSDKLLAIANDSLAVAVEAYELPVAEADLTQICDAFLGMNFVLVDPAATKCILFTAYDFKLIAGPLAFVTAIVGEPRAARAAFLEFAEDQPGSLRATAARAAEYMSWIDAPQ